MTTPRPLAHSERNARLALIAVLLALCALAWVALYPMHLAPMTATLVDGPSAAAMPWTGRTTLLLFAMWSVMMAGMMIPAATPMVVTVERIARGRLDPAPFGVAAMFVLAYVGVWTALSAVATAAQWAAGRAGLLSGAMASASPWLSGGIFLAAGLFQFTPQKHACLGRCRSPMGFLLTEWRPGARGGLVMGLRHGVFCVGCCWLLMALFFVFGTMNLLAAAGLAALVAAERLLPGGAVIARVAGIALMALGSVVLFRQFA